MSGHPSGHSHPHAERGSHGSESALRLVAWETTRNCNLSCVHCRASATRGPYTGELDTAEAFRLLDQIATVARPIVILTGGEPLLRPDIFDVAAYGNRLGLRMVMAPNGTLITDEIAQRLAAVGIQRLSISLDGASAETHDAFRKVPGAFAGALRGIECIKRAGIAFQVNTTVTQLNLAQIPKIQQLAVELGAVAHHIFLLVPTGRGKYIVDQAIDADAYERTLNWFYEQRDKTRSSSRRPARHTITASCANAPPGRQIGVGPEPRPGRCHARLPGRHRLLLHLPHGRRTALRFPGHHLRQCPPGLIFRDLETFGHLHGPARLQPPGRQVRRLRVQTGLRWLPGAGLRSHRELSRQRTPLQLCAAFNLLIVVLFFTAPARQTR